MKSEVLVGTVENKVPPTQTDLSRADISERGSPENMDNLDDDSSYYVTWTVYIALAFPPGALIILGNVFILYFSF